MPKTAKVLISDSSQCNLLTGMPALPAGPDGPESPRMPIGPYLKKEMQL